MLLFPYLVKCAICVEQSVNFLNWKLPIHFQQQPFGRFALPETVDDKGC